MESGTNTNSENSIPSASQVWFDEETRSLEYCDSAGVLKSHALSSGDDLMPEISKILSAGGQICKAFVMPQVERLASQPDDSRVRRFVISDGLPDRGDSVIKTDGWKFKAWKANPVVLWAHESWSLPIAQGLTVKLEGAGDSRIVVSTAEFETHEFAQNVLELIDRGTLRASSVGMKPLKIMFNEERGGIDFISQELLEWSIVPIPQNPRALLLAANDGVNLAPLRKWSLGILDGIGGEPGRWLPEAKLKATVEFMQWSNGIAFFDLGAEQISKLTPSKVAEAMVEAVRLGAEDEPAAEALAAVGGTYSEMGMKPPWESSPEAWEAYRAAVPFLIARDDRSLAPVLAAAGFTKEAKAIQATAPAVPEEAKAEEVPAEAAPQPVVVPSGQPTFSIDPEMLQRAVSAQLEPLRLAKTAETGRLYLPDEN